MSKLFVDEIVHQSSQGSGTITIGASGESITLNGNKILKPNNVAWKVRLTGSAQSISSATWTKINCNTVYYDVGGNYDNTTNFRFTAPVAGYYLLGVSINNQNATNNGGYMYCHTYVNGNTDDSTYPMGIRVSTVPLGSDTQITGIRVTYLNSGDYVEAFGYIEGSSPAFRAGRNWFWGYLLG